MRKPARKLIALLVFAVLFMSAPAPLFLDAAGLSHELEHERIAAAAPDDASGTPSDVEHRLMHVLGQCEPGPVRPSHALVECGAQPAPAWHATVDPLSADPQSSFRPPRSRPA
jgi:hypothetical protein